MASGKDKHDEWIDVVDGIDWRNIPVGVLPTSNMIYGFDTAERPKTCEHEYINVGFVFDKFICKKCDCEKK